MQRIGHVDALPEVVVREEDHVPRPWIDAHEVEHLRQPDAGPFGDERPAFFARLMRDLRVRRIASSPRARRRTGARRGHRRSSRQSRNPPASSCWYASAAGGSPFTGTTLRDLGRSELARQRPPPISRRCDA